MKKTVIAVRRLAVGAAVLGVALSPLSLSAQSELDASEAEAFMGSWVIAMETDFGPFSMNLDVKDEGGKVAAAVGAPEMGPDMQSITDITRDGESLVLVWEMDAQGQFFEVNMSLERDGENLAAWFEVGGGEFAAGGVGTRQDG